MKKFLVAFAFLFAFTTSATAQTFFANTQTKRLDFYHATVGTTTTAAIPAASVGGNIISWKLCNDAVNTSTYLIVGKATDVATDGVMLAPGACFECPNCVGAGLSSLKVKGQAAANGYSVTSYRN